LFWQDRDTSQLCRLINDFRSDQLVRARGSQGIEPSNKKTRDDPNTTANRQKFPPARDRRSLAHDEEMYVTDEGALVEREKQGFRMLETRNEIWEAEKLRSLIPVIRYASVTS